MISADRLHALGLASYPGDAFTPPVLYAIGNIGGAVTFNRANGPIQSATATSNITVTISNGANYDELTVILTASGATRNVTLDASILFPNYLDSTLNQFGVASGKTSVMRFIKGAAGVWTFAGYEAAIHAAFVGIAQKANSALIGAVNGIATLDEVRQLSASQIPGSTPGIWGTAFGVTSFSNYTQCFAMLNDTLAGVYYLAALGDVDFNIEAPNGCLIGPLGNCPNMASLSGYNGSGYLYIDLATWGGAFPRLFNISVSGAHVVNVYTLDGAPALRTISISSGDPSDGGMSKDDFFHWLAENNQDVMFGSVEISGWNNGAVTAASDDARAALIARSWTLSY